MLDCVSPNTALISMNNFISIYESVNHLKRWNAMTYAHTYTYEMASAFTQLHQKYWIFNKHTHAHCIQMCAMSFRILVRTTYDMHERSLAALMKF